MDDSILKILEDNAHKEAAKFGITGKGTVGTPPGVEDDLDAFRHAYTNAIYTYRFGKTLTGAVSEAIEIRGDERGNGIRSGLMDRHNNKIGQQIGLEAKSEEEIAQIVFKAYSSGELILDSTPEAADPRINKSIMQRMNETFKDSDNDASFVTPQMLEELEPETIIIEQKAIDKFTDEIESLNEEKLDELELGNKEESTQQENKEEKNDNSN